jgi:hypothetical protein
MSEMTVNIKRFVHQADYTIGALFIDGEVFGFTMEDEKRLVKVKGETRIPEGVCPLKLRKQLTPMTKRYRERYSWFTWFVEICDVPNFSHVYVHIGNTEKNTNGCPLIGYTADIDPKGNGFVGKSTKAFYDWQMKVAKHLENGGTAKIIIE